LNPAAEKPIFPRLRPGSYRFFCGSDAFHRHEKPPHQLLSSVIPPDPADPTDPLAGLPPSKAAAPPQRAGLIRNAGLMLGALGVVFGDIGTSPLYALRQTVLATASGFSNHVAVMGSLSMIFWALLIVVTLKYVTTIMRADNNGEGGTLALAALAHRSPGQSRRL